MPSLALILFLLALAWALFSPVMSSDLGWQIAIGRYVVEVGDVPRTNFLSFTAADQPWVVQEWLSGLIFAGVDHAAGLAGLMWLRGVLWGGLLVALYKLGRRLGAEPLSLALLMVLEGVQLALHGALRPWLFSNLALVGTLALCLRAGEDRRAFWVLPGLLGTWSLLHGGWAWGGAVVGAFGLQWLVQAPPRGPRRWEVLLGGGVAASLISIGPYGLQTLLFPFRYLGREADTGVALMYDQVKEWAPPELGSLFGVLLLLQGALTLVALWRSRVRDPALALAAVVFFVMALKVARHIPLFVITSFPLIVRGLLTPLAHRVALVPGSKLAFYSELEGRPRLPLAAAGVLVLWVGLAVQARSPGFEAERFHPRGYPIEIVDRLAELPGGRLLNYYDWGGLTPWRAPQWRMFITPVPDAYPAGVFSDWFLIANLGPDWDQALAEYRVDAVLFPSSSALVEVLAQRPEWRVEATDARATLLVRAPEPPPAPPPTD